MEIGKAYIDAFIKQSEFLATLGMSTFGGTVALIVWIVLNSTQGSGAISFRWKWTLVVALIFESGAVFFYYLSVGQIINLIPEILKLNPMLDNKFFEKFPSEYQGLLCLAKLQAYSFGLGILSIVVFAGRNSKFFL